MAFAITLMEHVFVPKEDLGNFAMKVSLLIDYLTIQLKPRCNLAGVRNLVNLMVRYRNNIICVTLKTTKEKVPTSEWLCYILGFHWNLFHQF